MGGVWQHPRISQRRPTRIFARRGEGKRPSSDWTWHVLPRRKRGTTCATVRTTILGPMNLLTTIRNRFHPLWRIRRTPWLFNFFHRLDFPVWARCRSLGVRMRVMWFRDMPWLFQSLPREPEFNRVIERVCEIFQPKVFWDIGANVGWFTWLVNARAIVLLVGEFPRDVALPTEHPCNT